MSCDASSNASSLAKLTKLKAANDCSEDARAGDAMQGLGMHARAADAMHGLGMQRKGWGCNARAGDAAWGLQVIENGHCLVH